MYIKKYTKILILFLAVTACFTLGFLGAIGVSSFDFSSIRLNAKSLPRIFIIESGSMEPAIKTGGIVIVKPADRYLVNDIVTFSYDEGASSKSKKDLITHRIEYKGYDSAGAISYKTSGDANKSFDLREIGEKNIIGKVIFTMPYLGYFADFAKKPQGFILLIVVPATIIIYEELKSLWRELGARFKKYTYKGSLKSRFEFRHFAIIIPFFGALLLFASFSQSFFSDKETSNGNSFAAFVPTQTQAPISPPVANHVVISEVQINGANANQDFVELYNPTNLSIDLNGWQIQKKTSTGTISSLVLIPSGKSIPAHGYFLWANNQTIQNPFSVSVGADVSNSNNIGENNSIALENAGDVIVDQVGWGTGTNQYVEGSLINNGSDTNKSMERKAYSISTQATMEGGIHSLKGNGFDGNDNSTDFILRTVSQPQNSSSPTETP